MSANGNKPSATPRNPVNRHRRSQSTRNQVLGVRLIYWLACLTIFTLSLDRKSRRGSGEDSDPIALTLRIYTVEQLPCLRA